MTQENEEIKVIGKYATVLSIIEIGLGSFLHAFKIPFRGHSLSLNQGFILTKASVDSHDSKNASYISTCSALLKSLSPAGNKLSPMLAINMQGQLYTFGLLIFGNNILGQIIGMILLSLWGFIQPFCLYLLLFGKDLIFMIQYFIERFGSVFSITVDNLIYVVLSIVFCKILIGTGLVFAARKISNHRLDDYIIWAQKYKKENKKEIIKTNPFFAAIKDLLNPLFLFTFVLTGIFFFYASDSSSQAIWKLLRPLALGYLIFLILRIVPIEVLSNKILKGKRKDLFNEVFRNLK